MLLSPSGAFQSAERGTLLLSRMIRFECIQLVEYFSGMRNEAEEKMFKQLKKQKTKTPVKTQKLLFLHKN